MPSAYCAQLTRDLLAIAKFLLLLSTGNTESFSVQNTLEKKSHKTSALLSSVAANIKSPLSIFKVPNGVSALFVFVLTKQNCLGLSLRA